jgi:hypothetical protein
MALYPITLIFIDEQENHNNALSQIGKEMYSNVVCFHEIGSLKDFINESDKNDSFLLFIHVFKEDKKRGYDRGIRMHIAREYPNLKIHWVTRDKPEIVANEINEPKNVFKYDEIPNKIDDNTLKPTKQKDCKGQSVVEVESGMEKEDYIFISHSSQDEKIVKYFI